LRRSAFDQIVREMEKIRYRLDDIESFFSMLEPQPLEMNESKLLLMPDHLRKTYMGVASKGECNATEVSNLTGRSRAAESNYLNQLVKAGWLEKRRRSKETLFLASEMKTSARAVKYPHKSVESNSKFQGEQQSQSGKVRSRVMKVKCLSSDYDGTISPLDVSRSESHVPLETRVMLCSVSRLLPISIDTMKDLSFVMPRTPFAHAWSGMGGLEMQIGKRVLKRESLESKLPTISLAINHARSHIVVAGVEIEEKNDSEGRTVAFCVDWRRTEDLKAANEETENVASFCQTMGLIVSRYENQPFYDVYPVAPDKGQALREMLSGLAVNSGVLYLGDSEADNSAFRASSISLGVVHDATSSENLHCDYLIAFERVPDFLKALIANDLQFRSDFPMIKNNPNRVKQDLKRTDDKKALHSRG
jgi:trehalose-6-phosphatase